MSSSKVAGNYGVDAPYVPIISFVAAIAMVVYGFVQVGFSRWITFAIALLLFGQVVSYMYTTTKGKFVLWERIFGQLNLTGAARILDVGCGRGMVVITGLRAFPSAQGVGVDLWRSRDQSGNDPATTTANAQANGLADRLELRTEDMSDMHVASASFDVVTANVAIQNIKDRELRRKTIDQIHAATKPGGQIRIVDIQYVKQYAEDLATAGAVEVSIKNLGIKGWFGNPLYASKLVSATKPS